MELSDLRELIDLAQTLSFSTSAEHMFISQSALSKHIFRMEKELGIKLFDRNRQTVALTLAGSRFCNHAQRILYRYDMALKEIQIDAERLNGVIRIGFLDAAVRSPLRSCVRTFSERYPGIQVHTVSLELGDLERDLQDSKIDIGITIKFSNSEWPRDVHFVELYCDGLAAVVSPTHPLAERSYIEFEELLGYPFLMPSKRQYPDLGRLLTAMAAVRERNLDVAYEFSAVSSGSMMVESGDYVTAMPLHISKLFEGSRFINLTDSEALIQIGAKWRSNCQAPGIEQFVELLIDSFEAPQGT